MVGEKFGIEVHFSKMLSVEGGRGRVIDGEN